MNKITCYDLECWDVAVQFQDWVPMPKWAIIWFWIEVTDEVLRELQWEQRKRKVRKILNDIVREQFNH